MFKHITRKVWMVSLISLFNDFSSEMLYPIIPLYLAQIGYGSILIGFIEGLAECFSGLSKIYLGSLSDTMQKRLPFIQIGYALSVLSRPLIGLSTMVGLVMLGRTSDRIGKGIRGSARDAILGDESNDENRAEVFGFHRSMDTFGAILGPLVAMCYLYFYPNDYKSVFLITMIPGLVAIFFTFKIKEKTRQETTKKKVPLSLKTHFSYFINSPSAYKSILIPLVLFSAINSSDMFLILRAKEIGISGNNTIFLYLLFNLVYALSAFPIGKLADRFGRMLSLKIGLMIYALSYFLLSFNSSFLILILTFCLYGLFYAFTHGVIKSIILERVPPYEKSKAIGLYEGLSSFGLLFANAMAGLLWHWQGASTMFLFTGIMSILVLVTISDQFKKVWGF